MIFDRDKQPKREYLPFIFKKQQQQNQEENKSLYKSDSQSSRLTIYPENFILHHDKTNHQTLNVKHSFVSNDQQNNLSIKKYLKKGEEFNKLNAKKLFKIQKTQENAFININSQNFKLPKEYSINRFDNQIDWRDKSEQKNTQKVYASQNKQKKPNSKTIEIYLNKTNNKRKSNLSKLSQLSQPKIIKKLINQEVQTDKPQQKNIKKIKKINPSQNPQKNNAPKINTFETLQKLNSNFNNEGNFSNNMSSRFINQQNLSKNKSKFINLSSILQKDQEQPQPPKKINSVRHNNIQTKYILNQSFSGQQSTAPSLYAHSYLDSMSKLSYTLTNDIQMIRKKNRYDPASPKQQRYSKVVQQNTIKQYEGNRGSKNNLRQASNSIQTDIGNNKVGDNPNFQPSLPSNLLKRMKTDVKNPSQSKINDSHQNKPLFQKNLNKNDYETNLPKKLPTLANQHSQKSISLSIVPELTQTNEQYTNFHNKQFHSLKTINQDNHELNPQNYNQQNKYFNAQMNQGDFNKDHYNSQNNYDNYFNNNSQFQLHSHPNPSKNLVNRKVKKVDQIMQFPQVSQIKISNAINQNQINQIKRIHPIRNNFNQKQASWIANSYQAKSKILQKINFQTFQIKKYRNGVYFGQLVDNKKQGHGIIFYFTGKLYEGQFKKDLKHGNGFQEFPDGSKYQGQFRQGIKNGKGTFQWNNGQVYQGQWFNGKKHGSGMWKSSQGESYLGQWKDGLVQGFGVYISKNGDRYEGQFKNSQKQGLGTQRYSNGQTYVGQYRKNRPNGQGQYFWANGNYYKGQFVNHLRHGQGYFKDLKNNQTYQGQYRNDKKCGYGQLKSGQKTYIGNFQNDYKHGYGELYQNDECIYKGYWVNGKSLEEDAPSEDQQFQNNNFNKTNNNLKNNTNNKAKIEVIPQKPELNNKPMNPRFNRLISNNGVKNKIITKSISPQNKSLQSAQNSLDNSNPKRSCGCSRRH